jgi:hypothetical protein
MGLFGFGKKKKESSDLSVEEGVINYVDPRILEKMKQSDLLEFLDKQRAFGKDVDVFYGKRLTPDNSVYYHTMQLTSLNSGIVSKENFGEWGYSESEINAIFGNSKMKMGLSHPSRCVKDLIWAYMFNQEQAKSAIRSGNDELAEGIVEGMEIRKSSTKWLDWDRAIEEFWDHESGKDYRSYIITD